MNEDFEEDYEEEEDDGREDFREAREKAKEARDKYKEEKAKKAENNKSSQNSNNDPTSHNDAREFNKSQNAKNQARTQNPDAATKQLGQESAKKTGEQVGKEGVKKAGEQAGKEAAKKIGEEAGKEAVKQVGQQAAANVAVAGGSTAAGAGATAAVAAIPVAGWIIAAVMAAIALLKGLKKARDKHDKKMAENGIDSKSIRRLIKLSPILVPILIFFIVIIIIVVFMQAETADRIEVMQRALTCFESNGSSSGCQDFMNTGIHMGWNTGGKKPLIKKTDMDIAHFVIDYIRAENKVYKNNQGFSLNEAIDSIANQDYLDDPTLWEQIVAKFQQLIDDSIIGDVREAWYLFKWLKIEKKVFNNITWLEGSLNKTGISWWQRAVDEVTIKITEDPMDELERVTYSSSVSWIEMQGFHWDITTAWLEIPADNNIITLDEAISLTKEYIPSFIEIYATFIASGESYKMADKVYDYYVKNTKKGKPLELIIKTYEKIIVDVTEYRDEEVTEKYYRVTNGEKIQITKSQYAELEEQVNQKKRNLEMA